LQIEAKQNEVNLSCIYNFYTEVNKCTRIYFLWFCSDDVFHGNNISINPINTGFPRHYTAS